MSGIMQCGDPNWIITLQQAFDTALADTSNDASDVRFSISEEYLEPPPDLRPTSGALGWTCRIEDGKVIEFTPVPDAGADVVVQLDYSVFDELARIIVDGDAAQQLMERRAGEALGSGRMRMTGSLGNAAALVMAKVHDTMAKAMLVSTKETS
ncbi:MAG: hypothetical protein ABIR68_19580 [Ilumatobacteraceae bacterium]